MIRMRVWATATAAFFFARELRCPPKRRTRRWNWAPGRVLVREQDQADSIRTLARCWLPWRVPAGRRRAVGQGDRRLSRRRGARDRLARQHLEALAFRDPRPPSNGSLERRSEERRVGKECRSRWSPYTKKTIAN